MGEGRSAGRRRCQFSVLVGETNCDPFSGGRDRRCWDLWTGDREGIGPEGWGGSGTPVYVEGGRQLRSCSRHHLRSGYGAVAYFPPAPQHPSHLLEGRNKGQLAAPSVLSAVVAPRGWQWGAYPEFPGAYHPQNRKLGWWGTHGGFQFDCLYSWLSHCCNACLMSQLVPVLLFVIGGP